jgi:hypothetical protein
MVDVLAKDKSMHLILSCVYASFVAKVGVLQFSLDLYKRRSDKNCLD